MTFQTTLTVDSTPAEARAELVRALRSGEYDQARVRLRKDNGFCCLGVACDLYTKAGGKGQWVGDFFGGFKFEYSDGCSEDQILPHGVQEWLGFYSNNGRLSANSAERRGGCLSEVNDAGASFEVIADLIESGNVALRPEL